MFSSLKTEFTNRLSLTDANQILILGDFLDSLDLYLIANGINFTTENTIETKTFYNRELYSKETFSFPAWLQTSGATVKLIDNSNELILIEETDYSFFTSLASPKPACNLILLDRMLFKNQKLEITGIWKFGETLPVDLKLAGLQLASQFLAKSNQNLTSQSGFVKSSVSIDKVSYDLKLAEIKSSFQDKDFQNVLSFYKL